MTEASWPSRISVPEADMSRTAHSLAAGLASGPVRLRFDRVLAGDPVQGLAQAYHFRIQDDRAADAGHINFRIGESYHVVMIAGHVGFEVLPPHRGSSYAYHACRALAPFARHHYEEVVLTSDPHNAASIRTIERLGAKFLGEVTVPESDPAFPNGARHKRRYSWKP